MFRNFVPYVVGIVSIQQYPPCNSSQLKMDGWNTIWFPFGAKAYFQVVLLLVSGSVNPWICLFDSWESSKHIYQVL